MAVEVVSGPPAITDMSNCIRWVIRNTVDEVGANNWTHKLVWQLFEDDGTTEIFPQSAVAYPTVGLNVEIDFLIDFFENGLVAQNVPTILPAGTALQSQMVRRVILKLWDLILDNDCIIAPAFNNQLDNPSIRVVNSVCQPYEEIRDFTIPQILTSRPSDYVLCEGQYDWISIWMPDIADKTVTLNVGGVPTVLNLTGNEVTQINLSTVASNPNWTGGATTMSVKVNDLGNIRPEFNITIDDCCCDGLVQVIFEESKGSFHTFLFDELSRVMVTENTEVCYVQSCDFSLSQRLAEAGKSLESIVAYERYTFIKSLELSDENLEIVRTFCDNPNKFIVREINGEDQILKFIVPSANFTIDEENLFIELTITGNLAIDRKRNVLVV